MITAIISIFTLLLIVHYVLYLLRVPSSRWTELLGAVVEPVLDVTRMLIGKFLPQLAGKGIDWSPFVLLIALHLLKMVAGLLNGLPFIGWLF